MATDLERLVVSLEASITKYEKTMARAQGVTNASLTKVENRVGQSAKVIEGQFSRAGNALTQQSANIAAQFQDIAVQLQSGTSPFTVALQQGTQLSAVLGQAGGIGAGVKALSSAFLSLISPVQLATIALIAAGGAALQYFTSDSEAEELTEALKRQDEVIRGLKDAYGAAAAGFEDYARRSRVSADEDARQQIASLQSSVLDSAQDLFDQLDDEIREIENRVRIFQETMALPEPEIPAGFERLQAVFTELGEDLKDGEVDLLAYRDRLIEIANDTGADETIRDLARESASLSADVRQAAQELAGLVGVTQSLSDEAIVAAGQVRALANAIKSLDGLALPSLDDEARALNEYTEGLKNARTAGERAAVEASFIAAQERLNRQKLERTAPIPGGDPRRDLANDPLTGEPVDDTPARSRRRGGGGTRKREDTSFDQFVKRTDERIEALRQESLALEQFGGNVEKARVYVDGLMAAQAQGVPVTNELRASIEAQADAFASGVSEVDRFIQAQRDAQRAAAELADDARDLFGGFISDLRAGADAGEAFANVLDKIADKAINAALDSLFSGGGIFGAIFGGGRASGGPVRAGMAYRVGETGPETFVPSVNGRIVPDRARMAGAGSVVYQGGAITINADGADPAQLARLTDEVKQLRATQAKAAVSAVRAQQLGRPIR